MALTPARGAALITGGAGRLGLAIGAALRREGTPVAVTDVDEERLARARRRATPGEAAFVAIGGDCADPGDVSRIVDEAEAAVGPLGILVTCAAVYPNVPLVEMEAAAWDRVYAVNVRGVMLAAQCVARRWIARGFGGAIVNLSSAAGRSARRGAAAYCGSKAAVEMLTQVLALELGPYGIRVNAVAPGLVMDEVLADASGDAPAYVREMLRATPLGRTGSPDDVADAVVFLASGRAAWTTGSTLDVTGGSHCGRSHLDYTPREIAASSDPGPWRESSPTN